MKKTYWSKYNNELIRRGKVTFWFDKEISKTWYSKQMPAGRYTDFYSDEAITALITLKYFYSLTFRETKGLAESLVELMNMELDIPCYTTLSSRQKKLSLKIIKTLESNESVHIVVDSTGLKVYGEGEWKVRKHGVGKRRTWTKLHLAVDESNNQILAVDVTGNDMGDCESFDKLIDELKDENISQVSGDGAYDTKDCYKKVDGVGARGVFPPRKGAKIEQHGNSKKPSLQRDEHIRNIRKNGRSQWKKEEKYHQRSLSETAMYRFKVKFTEKMASRDFKAQINECLIKCNILNKMPTPKSI